MKIAVTGANGFVGSNIVKALSVDNEVVAVSRKRLHPINGVNVKYIDDLDQQTDWGTVLDGVETVLHLAARVHVMKELEQNPLPIYRRVNVDGTRALAEACVKNSVQNLVFLSSIKVNGEATFGRCFSSADQPNPMDPYAVSKLEAELALQEIAMGSTLKVTTLRSPLLYGTGVKGNMQRILRLIHSRVPLPFGSIKNQRTLLSINNLAQWIRSVITSPADRYNLALIGDPAPVSTRSMVHHMGRGMGHAPWLLPVPKTALQLASRTLSRPEIVERLTGDLEIAIDEERYVGLSAVLRPTSEELFEFGKSYVSVAARKPGR